MADDIWQSEWRENDGRPENFDRVAIIKLDPISSKSTGGTVIAIEMWKYTMVSKEARTDTQYINSKFEYDDDYKCVKHDTAQTGWIMQDKTGILMDSNIKD